MGVNTKRTYAEVNVELVERLHLLVGQGELGDLEVAQQAVVVVALGDDGETLLECPAEEDLGFSCTSTKLSQLSETKQRAEENTYSCQPPWRLPGWYRAQTDCRHVRACSTLPTMRDRTSSRR